MSGDSMGLRSDVKPRFTVECDTINNRFYYLGFYDIPSDRVIIGVDEKHDNIFKIIIVVTSEDEWSKVVDEIIKYHKHSGDIFRIKRMYADKLVLPLTITAIHGRKIIHYHIVYRPREPIIGEK